MSAFSHPSEGRWAGIEPHCGRVCFPSDPWWNPAAEAQASDRSHRIGQLRRVFAYRLIAKDTVEGKVLELQKTPGNSVLAALDRETREMLLS